MSISTRASARRLLTAGLTAVTLTTALPALAYAAPAFAPAAPVITALADDTLVAEYDQKLAVAVKFGLGDNFALIERVDRDFVIGIWEHVKDNPDFAEVRIAAEQAFSTTPDPADPLAADRACYEFIVTEVYAAYDRDIAREKREADAKRASDQARSTAAASIDIVADAALLNGTDAEFIDEIWERVADDARWVEVKNAAVAVRNGTAEEQAEFIATGMAAAAKAATERRIREDADRTEAEKAAALARSAKQFAANRIGLPVTEQLLSMPDRDFITEVWNFAADGTEVQAGAIAAVRSLDPAVWKAFIDTGIHEAKNRDIQKALAAAEAEDRRLVQDVLTRATKSGNRNLALAARNALAGDATKVSTFLRTGQYTVRPDLPERLQVGHSGMCLGIPNDLLVKGTGAVQWTCSAAKNQGWKLMPKADGSLEIRNNHSGQCLAIGSASKTAGAAAVQWTCNNAKEQEWTPVADATTGLTRLKNTNSGLCLSINDAVLTNGGKAVQEACAAKPETGWHVRARGLVNFVGGAFNGDAHDDVIAAELAGGRLWLYPGTAAGDAFGTRVLIGTGGWNNMDKLTLGKFSRDDFNDVVAVDKRDAKLYLYPGTATATLGARIEIGSGGWNGMDKLTSGRFGADAYEDLVAVEVSTGKLWVYPGTSAGKLGTRIEIGTGGWNGMDKLTVGRFGADAFDDVVAVERATGKLWLYPGTAAGKVGTRIEIGTGGWNGMAELSVGRFNSDGYDDILATQNSTGKLWMYPGKADGTLGSRVELGIGG